MSGIKVVTAWTTSAVATSDQKSFMRVDFSDDDSLIAELIKASQNVIETYLNRAITTQTLELYLDRLPFYSDINYPEGTFTAPDMEYNSNFIVLPKPPVASVTHVKYFDDSDTEYTYAATNYYVDTISDQARIVLRQGKSWPTVTQTRNANAYVVKYVAGYGGASDVPEPIVQAIKLLTAHLYENREAVTSLGVNAIPYTIGAMLQPYRILRSQSILGG
tara:strand:- start:231 stop:887 length:657 start_codon:yes stop_codon:yes gene_type:complete